MGVMGVRRVAMSLGNAILRPFGAEIIKTDDGLKPWDHDFIRWIAEAERKGVDPNDVGDADWGMQVLTVALERDYFPNLKATDIVLELGPGTGRLTRHLVGRVASLVLVDYSKYVIEYIDRYLDGKIPHRTVLIDRPAFVGVEANSIDVCLANGVLEHMDPDDVCWTIGEFGRVLKPGGLAIFNFNDISSPEWAGFYSRERGAPGDRCIFRFYHPEVIGKYASLGGLEVERMVKSDHRLTFAHLRKPG